MTDQTSPQTPWWKQYPYEQMLNEYADLSKAVREAMTSVSQLLQPGLITLILAVFSLQWVDSADTAGSPGSTVSLLTSMGLPAWVPPFLPFACAALLAIYNLRRVAEFHAMGGHKRAIESAIKAKAEQQTGLLCSSQAVRRSAEEQQAHGCPIFWESRLIDSFWFKSARRLADLANILGLVGLAYICLMWGQHVIPADGGDLRSLKEALGVTLIAVVLQWAAAMAARGQTYRKSVNEFEQALHLSIPR